MNRAYTIFLLLLVLILLCSGVALISLRFFQAKKNTSNGSTVSQQLMTGKVTNQWYSSLYFSDWSSPLFAYPLATQLQKEGLSVSYPQIVGTPKTVYGSFDSDFLIGEQSTFIRKEVVSADPTSVKVKICTLENCLETRIAHGSPVLHIHTEKKTSLTVIAKKSPTHSTQDSSIRLAFSKYKYLFGVLRNKQWVPMLDVLTITDQSYRFSLEAGDQLVLGLDPMEKELTLDQIAPEITGSELSFSKKNEPLSSTISYLFETNTSSKEAVKKPLIALLPHQWKDLTETPIGTYNSLRGTMKLYATDSIKQTLTTPLIPTVGEMVNSLDENEKKLLQSEVSSSIKLAETEPITDQIYDGGKQAFKFAQLFEIANATQHPDRQKIKTLLASVLSTWLSAEPSTVNSPFQITENPYGVIAKKPQYGNEQFNDHHFHYGYYLAAAGILIQQDSTYAEKLKPGLTALVADIGSTDTKTAFPYLRGFDPYESHSWADGRATAADGNNQESTSEAINRWYGMLRLGRATKNEQLESTALHGLAMEQEAARIYWLGQKPDLYAFPQGYEHPMTSLIWGGKVDYATWFSPLPSHIYGIQMLPSSPAMTHLQDAGTWKKYGEYVPTQNGTGWDDIRAMGAVMNGEKVSDSQKQYEAGNTSAWYYLWTRYWTHKNS